MGRVDTAPLRVRRRGAPRTYHRTRQQNRPLATVEAIQRKTTAKIAADRSPSRQKHR